jgi:microcystin-dependent protein
MANQPENSVWEAGVYQLETTDFVIGGVGGVSNQPILQLANRTRYLYDQRAVTNAAVATNASNISALQTTQANILAYWPIHKRHTILDGPVNSAGVPNALKIISGAARTVGFDDTSVDNLSSPMPFWVAYSNGYETSARITGAEDFIKRLGTSVTGSGTFTLNLPSGDKDWMIILKYNTGTSTSSLDYVETPENGGYIVAAYQPTSAPTRALWFNPFTQKHKITTNAGVAWADVICVGVGVATIASAALTATKTYSYQTQLYDFDTPQGTVIWQASEEMPNGGYLYCDGSAISRSLYARLFAKLGTNYGVGDGSTTFNLPDLRGYFIRGFDDGAGVDSGRVFGSTQQDELEAHDHDLTVFQGGGGAGFTNPNAGSTGTPQTIQTEATTGTETRPKNVAMKAWIKF